MKSSKKVIILILVLLICINYLYTLIVSNKMGDLILVRSISYYGCWNSYSYRYYLTSSGRVYFYEEDPEIDLKDSKGVLRRLEEDNNRIKNLSLLSLICVNIGLRLCPTIVNNDSDDINEPNSYTYRVRNVKGSYELEKVNNIFDLMLGIIKNE